MGNSNHKKLSRARVVGPTMGHAVAGWLPNCWTHSGVRERTDLSGLFFALIIPGKALVLQLHGQRAQEKNLPSERVM